LITKFKIFEAISLDYPLPLFKVGDTVYYHGRLREHHGYYIVKNRYHASLFQQAELEKGDTGWRYDLNKDGDDTVYIRGSWEMSSSPTEEEGKRKDAEFHKRKEDQRLLHIDFDPYGEEIWEHNDVDPYGEEDWEDKNKNPDIFDILLPDEDFDDREDRYFHRVGECRRCGRYAPDALMLDDVCPACREEDNKCNICGSYVPHEFLHDGICDACLKEHGWDF
jgi:hypothetical protein